MIIQILIECLTCYKKQYANSPVEAHSCYHCSSLLTKDEYRECTPEEEGMIQHLRQMRRDAFIVDLAYYFSRRDLENQFSTFSNMPYQKKSVELAMNRLNLRKSRAGEVLQHANDELALLNYVEDPSYVPQMAFNFNPREELIKQDKEILITKNKIKQDESN